jgi:hypothetical protein
MEARYARRKTELLQDCEVIPEIFDQVIPRLTAQTIRHFEELRQAGGKIRTSVRQILQSLGPLSGI